jgi:hypothetical protein
LYDRQAICQTVRRGAVVQRDWPNLGLNDTGYIRITSPFINAGGLSVGSYRVDIHINGEYLASGEFTVE